MSITLGFILEEIRECLSEYQNPPHGTKTRWLKQQSFSTHQLFFDGLDQRSGVCPGCERLQGVAEMQECRNLIAPRSFDAGFIFYEIHASSYNLDTTTVT